MSQDEKKATRGKRCPVCGRRVRTNFDKTVRDHYRDKSNTEGFCPGSRKEPVQELRGERVTRR